MPTTLWTHCTAQRADGSFCDVRTLPDAPFPICVKHAAQVFKFIRQEIEERRGLSVSELTVLLDTMSEIAAPPLPPDRPPVVYYLRVGDFIKVGRTVSLESRLNGYPPDAVLLATEPGDFDVERHRLDQFEQLRTHRREWFSPGAAIIEHINDLRRRAGDQPVNP